MKKDKLVAIGYLDNGLIEKAEMYSNTNGRKPVMRWAVIAACLCVAIIGVFSIPRIIDGTRGQDYAERVIYRDAEYFVVSNNLDSLFEECGLPDIITEDLAGDFIGYFEMGEKNIYHLVEGATTGHAVLFEYAPQPNDNVFIVQINGKYCAAIRKDSEGYHGVYEGKQK